MLLSVKRFFEGSFYFSIGQNYSPEAAVLLLKLQAIIGVGNIKIELNNTGKPHIRYVVSNTKDILDKIVPYGKMKFN